jgi:hypothetical protein
MRDFNIERKRKKFLILILSTNKPRNFIECMSNLKQTFIASLFLLFGTQETMIECKTKHMPKLLLL